MHHAVDAFARSGDASTNSALSSRVRVYAGGVLVNASGRFRGWGRGSGGVQRSPVTAVGLAPRQADGPSLSLLG